MHAHINRKIHMISYQRVKLSPLLSPSHPIPTCLQAAFLDSIWIWLVRINGVCFFRNTSLWLVGFNGFWLLSVIGISGRFGDRCRGRVHAHDPLPFLVDLLVGGQEEFALLAPDCTRTKCGVKKMKCWHCINCCSFTSGDPPLAPECHTNTCTFTCTHTYTHTHKSMRS